MSDRAFKILLGFLTVALIAAAAASFALHGFTLSPLAILVGFSLLVLPFSLFMRLWFISSITSVANPEIRELTAERKRSGPQSSAPMRIAAASFLVSHVFLALLLFCFPQGIDSKVFQFFLLLWIGLFLFGALGLVYTSQWIQLHCVAIAFAGIPVFLCGQAVLLITAHDGFSFPDLIFVSIDLSMTGLVMFAVPHFVWYARKSGLID